MQGFEDVEERLNNWARWARSGDGVNPQSCVSMYSLLIAANLYAPDFRARADYSKPVDEKDAFNIDKQVSSLSIKHKRIIKVLWIVCPHENIGRVAKRAGVRRQTVAELYRNALQELKTRLSAF